MKKHTKTPWHISKHSADYLMCHTEDGEEMIVECYGEFADNNAAFICKAVNNYAELVGMIKELLGYAEDSYSFGITECEERAKSLLSKLGDEALEDTKQKEWISPLEQASTSVISSDELRRYNPAEDKDWE